jgi:hypothetical protein
MRKATNELGDKTKCCIRTENFLNLLAEININAILQ